VAKDHRYRGHRLDRGSSRRLVSSGLDGARRFRMSYGAIAFSPHSETLALSEKFAQSCSPPPARRENDTQ
jgi:hypothetical protein